MIDDSLFDCHILPQQGRNRATGLGTWTDTQPLWCQFGMAGVFSNNQEWGGGRDLGSLALAPSTHSDGMGPMALGTSTSSDTSSLRHSYYANA